MDLSKRRRPSGRRGSVFPIGRGTTLGRGGGTFNLNSPAGGFMSGRPSGGSPLAMALANAAGPVGGPRVGDIPEPGVAPPPVAPPAGGFPAYGGWPTEPAAGIGVNAGLEPPAPTPGLFPGIIPFLPPITSDPYAEIDPLRIGRWPR